MEHIPENVSSKSVTKSLTHNEGLWRITFDTNPDDCNMHCIMCEEHSEFSPSRKKRISTGRPHRRMNIAIIRSTVKEMSRFGLKEIIPSTMGEPLLYENFLEILEICKENGIMLNLTTNGTWPGYGPEKWAELICPVTKDVKVSWNGASASIQESIMKGSPFKKRREDLSKFVRARDGIAETGGNRCSITLQPTFLETNISELPQMVDMALELGIDRIKGHQLWVHFPEIRNLDMRRSKESIVKWNIVVDECFGIVKSKRLKNGKELKLDNFHKLSEEHIGEMPENWKCPFLGREGWVNYEGRFDPCCAPDAERITLGHFGRVSENGGFSQIWFGEKYKGLTSNYMTNSICRKCTLRRPDETERYLL